MATISGKWKFNSTIDMSDMPSLFVNFTSNGLTFTYMGVTDTDYVFTWLCTNDRTYSMYFSSTSTWKSENFRTVDFGDEEQTVDDDFSTWLAANAVLAGTIETDTDSTIETTSDKLTDITINGYVFKGFSDFTCINSKTYVVEPERSSDGSIPDINSYAVFYVPRVKISFKYMKIEDYRRFLVAIEPNEFVVSYYDYTKGETVYHKMYCEPQELEKLHTYRLDVLGILDKEISLIGTLNSVDTFALTYMANGGNGSESGQSYVAGETLHISTGSNLNRNGYTLQKWNTQADGSGTDIALGAYKIAEESNLTLYAIWASSSTYTLSFDYNGAEKPDGISDDDGNWVESKSVVYGQSIGTLPSPAVDGYEFGGWYVFVDYEPSKYNDDDIYKVKGSTTLTAKWSANDE